MQKINPSLWFAHEAEQAVNFYTSVFKNSAIGQVLRYGEEGHEIHKMPAGSILTIAFTIEGQDFMALNGGPVFKFNEAISFIINCDTQEEIDYYWDNLSAGGDKNAQECGWLKDKFGVSWQVTPLILDKYLADADHEKASRVMAAMLKMKKIDIKELQRAYNGH